MVSRQRLRHLPLGNPGLGDDTSLAMQCKLEDGSRAEDPGSDPRKRHRGRVDPQPNPFARVSLAVLDNGGWGRFLGRFCTRIIKLSPEIC